ncbi:hypothetical protein FYJ43_11195 [Cutibacterium sp. WCA-380-WT-3A]|uniref:Uncharacterized protein n=1 Tax=Cutibacterium porci TaxID=2605781 RepID=A0A7K0J9Z0_9ACTN|nr:hypothetical protein [Cutibacterium porci]
MKRSPLSPIRAIRLPSYSAGLSHFVFSGTIILPRCALSTLAVDDIYIGCRRHPCRMTTTNPAVALEGHDA